MHAGRRTAQQASAAEVARRWAHRAAVLDRQALVLGAPCLTQAGRLRIKCRKQYLVVLWACAGGSGCADPPAGGQDEGGACWAAQHQEHDDDDASHFIPGATALQAAVAATPVAGLSKWSANLPVLLTACSICDTTTESQHSLPVVLLCLCCHRVGITVHQRPRCWLVLDGPLLIMLQILRHVDWPGLHHTAMVPLLTML